jgi:hypothetical protein
MLDMFPAIHYIIGVGQEPPERWYGMSKVARCRACDRTHTESLVAGRGGLVYGKAPAQGRVACVCVKCMTEAARVADTIRSGKAFRWDTDDKAPTVRVEVEGITAESGAALWLSGWLVESSGALYRAHKVYSTAQGIDKAIHALPHKSTVRYIVNRRDWLVPAGGSAWFLVDGKADNRTAARFAFAWVKALHLAGAPALVGWNETAAESIVERANRSNRNVGIASIMA